MLHKPVYGRKQQPPDEVHGTGGDGTDCAVFASMHAAACNHGQAGVPQRGLCYLENEQATRLGGPKWRLKKLWLTALSQLCAAALPF